MNNRMAAALVLKVWGVLWLISAATGFFNTGLQLASGHFEKDQSLWLYAVRSGTLSWTFTFLVGLVLVRGGDAIARSLFPKEESIAIDVDARGLQTIGFSVLALYFALSALRSITTALYGLITKPREDSVSFLWARSKEGLVAAVVELIAATILFLGTPALVRFSRRLQEPWYKDPEANPPALPPE